MAKHKRRQPNLKLRSLYLYEGKRVRLTKICHGRFKRDGAIETRYELTLENKKKKYIVTNRKLFKEIKEDEEIINGSDVPAYGHVEHNGRSSADDTKDIHTGSFPDTQ